MKPKLTPIQNHKQYYQRAFSQTKPPNSKTLNLKLLSNPFINDQQHYRAIYNDLTLYNRRVLDKLITDQYEADSHQKLFTIISDLSNLDTGEDMITRLDETWKWWAQQSRKIKQRRDLGVVKYKVDKSNDKLKAMLEKMHHSQIIKVPQNVILPSEIREYEAFPFEMNFRTAHNQTEIHSKRLKQYKRKIININETHILDLEQTKKKKEKVTYPMPKKYVAPDQTSEDSPQNESPNQNPQGQAPKSQAAQGKNISNPQAVIPPPEDSNKPAQNPNKPQQAEDPNQQDLGMGLGEEPQQDQDENNQQQAPQQDKLAPKNKIYAISNRQRQEYDQTKAQRRPYMFYCGSDSLAQRRMQERTVLKQQYSLKLQRQEQEMIAKAHEWATLTEKVAKQTQFLLQTRILRPSYTLSYEDPQKKEMLSLADQKKYGFHVPAKTASKPEIQLRDKLPPLPQFRTVEKEVRRDRLDCLKHRLGSILQLKESSSQKVTPALSLCPQSPKRKDFSMILKENSAEKYREIELQQIRKIKQNLGKRRITVNIKTLSHALVPNAQDQKQQQFQSPPKQLPANPFNVQPKKKKKK